MTYLHAIDLDILGEILMLLSQDKLVGTELKRSVWVVVCGDTDCEDVHCIDAAAIVSGC